MLQGVLIWLLACHLVLIPAVTGATWSGGVNLSGFDDQVVEDGNFYQSGYVYPYPNGKDQAPYWISKGANIFRIPIAWQYVETSAGSGLTTTYWTRYVKYVRSLLQTSNVRVIVEVHNYAQYGYQCYIGESGCPSSTDFYTLWSVIAREFVSDSRIVFGIMNEPHDLKTPAKWPSIVQAAVNTIRDQGATSQVILLPGLEWNGASSFLSTGYPQMKRIVDRDGTTNMLVYDIHRYLDAASSGAAGPCVTNSVDLFSKISTTLRADGRQAFLSEIGGTTTGEGTNCVDYLKQALAYMTSNSDVWLGFTVWGAGNFAPSYHLAVVPDPKTGASNYLALGAIIPNFYTSKDLVPFPKRKGQTSSSAAVDCSRPTDPRTSGAKTCGSSSGFRCLLSECCSQYGYCGTTSAHCGSGCQTAFGKCDTSPAPSCKKIDCNRAVSTNKCGAVAGTRCAQGACCSSSNYCGTTSAYCGTGCQPEFGLCNSSPSSRCD